MKIFNRDTHLAACEAMRNRQSIELFGSRFIVHSVSWQQNTQTGAGSGTVDLLEVLAAGIDRRTVEGDVTIRAEGVVLPHHLQVTFNKD